MIKVAAFAAGLYVAGVVAGFACTPALPPEGAIVEAIENAAAVAQYKALLAPCRAKAIAAKDPVVFETCADAVDAELCRTKSLRCAGGVK